MWCANTARTVSPRSLLLGTLAARGVIRDVGRVLDMPLRPGRRDRQDDPPGTEYHHRQGAGDESGA